MFFIDRNLDGRKFVEPLREAGFDVELHRDHFVHDAPDDEWIPIVAAHGWIIVTADKSIRLNQHERRAVERAKARVIALSMGRARFEDLALNFVRSRAKIERFIKRHESPFIAVLSRPNQRDFQRGRAGRIELRFPKSSLR